MSAALLKALGPPAQVLVSIDFETYWSAEYSLDKLTTEAFVRDPRFEVVGVGVKVGSTPTVWLEEWEFREWAARFDWSKAATNAHHAQFDNLILSHHYGIRPRFIFCTMSIARALQGTGGVSLENLGQKYGVGTKGKELESTKGKRRADFTQDAWDRFGVYCCTDVDIAHGLVRAMPLPDLEYWLIDTTVRMFAEPVFEADQSVLAKTLTDERAHKAELLRRTGATKEILGSSDKFAALLRSMGVEPQTKISKTTGKPTYAFAKDDPGMVALMEHENPDVRALAEARQSVKSNGVETRTERLIAIGKRGPVPFYLKYSGAHTHRWSGGDKMNPQNFKRGGALREAILAPAGHVLVVADSGQIEARVVGWVAGHTALLDTFRRNDATDGDFYSDRGSTYFMKKLSKKETPNERQISKSMELGLGFGMGAMTFAANLLKGMLGAPPVQFGQKEAGQFGVDVPQFVAEAKQRKDRATGISDYDRIAATPSRVPLEPRLTHYAVTAYFVNLYRRANPKIVALWKAMGDMLPIMARAGGDPLETRATFGRMRFIHEGIVMPNGLAMRYPGLKAGKGGQFAYYDDQERKWKKVYGGLIAENVVQRLARDVVAEQVLWVRAAGYRIATTTHDEAVSVVPEAQGAECLAYMLARMKSPPTWCADLPLNASGGIARSYGDAK